MPAEAATVTFITRSFDQVRSMEYELDRQSLERCRWIAARDDGFTREEASAAVCALSDSELSGLQEALGDAGFIRTLGSY